MEKIFKIKEAEIGNLKSRIIKLLIPLVFVAGVVGLSIIFGRPSSEEFDFSSLFISIPLIAVVMVFVLRRGLNRQKDLFASFELTVGDYAINRVQKDTATITIAHSDIERITKHPNGSISIQGKDPSDLIGIPAQIEDMETLEQLLFAIKPNSAPTEIGFAGKYLKLLPFITLVLMGAVFISMNKFVVGICGILLLAVFGYSAYIVCNSKNIDSRTKRSMWLLVFVIISVLATMYYKLMIPAI